MAGFNTTTYKGYLLRIVEMRRGYYGVLAFKDGKPQVVSSGHQQYVGVGKTKREAITDAMSSVDMWKSTGSVRLNVAAETGAWN